MVVLAIQLNPTIVLTIHLASLNHGLNGETVQALVAKEPEQGQGYVQVRLIVLAIQLNLTNVLKIHLAAVNAR